MGPGLALTQLPARRRPWPRAAAGGVTLLELLVVLLVLSAVIALAGPAVGRVAEAARARAEVAGLVALFRHARERAILTRQAHVVVVDPATHRIVVTRDGDTGVESHPLPPRLTVEPEPPVSATIRFAPHGMSTGGSFRVHAGRVTFRLTVDPISGRARSRRE